MPHTFERVREALSRALRLQSVVASFDGDIGRFETHGRVIGDTVLSVAIVSGQDSQMTRIPLKGPVTLPALLPLRRVFAAYFPPASPARLYRRLSLISA